MAGDHPAYSMRLTKAKNVQIKSGISRQKMRRPRCCQRGFEEKPRGATKTQVKVMQVPTRKQVNIQCEAMRTSLSADTTSAGNAMVAPLKSSFRRMLTGSNQYRVLLAPNTQLQCPSVLP